CVFLGVTIERVLGLSVDSQQFCATNPEVATGIEWHEFFTHVHMSLSLYQKKRHFKETPEPKGKSKSSRGSLRFVVQKHDASHLHYDFRLEMEGVLKSWAVPKGPSLNPEDKRLAMMVEDHPYDYKNFEGIIPEGNYGAGTVIVWDEGESIAHKKPEGTKKEMEKEHERELKRGKVEISMKGSKLKGNFVLIKSSNQGQNSWLLKKMEDNKALSSDVLRKNKSVKSGLTIKQLKKEMKSNSSLRAATTQKKNSKVKSSAKSSSKSRLKKPSSIPNLM